MGGVSRDFPDPPPFACKQLVAVYRRWGGGSGKPCDRPRIWEPGDNPELWDKVKMGLDKS